MAAARLREFLSNPGATIAAGIGEVIAKICETGGGATQLFDQVLEKRLVELESPLYRVVQVLRALNLPITNLVNRNTQIGLVGPWLLERWGELFDAIRAYALDLQVWVYSIVARVYQFAVHRTLVGTQWGENLRQAYDLYRVERYWGKPTSLAASDCALRASKLKSA